MTVERTDGPNGHLYGEPDGLLVPGVTTIISEAMPVPARLARWQRRQDAAAGVRRGAGVELRVHAAPDAPEIVAEALDDADRRQLDTMREGSDIHADIESLLALAPTRWGRHIAALDESRPAVEAAATVVDELQLVDWRTEAVGLRSVDGRPVYGGTVDVAAFDADGAGWVIDWKTTAGDWPLVAYAREEVQAAAYCGLELDWAYPVAMQRAAVVRIARDGRFVVTEIDVDRRWDHWCVVLDLWRRQQLAVPPRRVWRSQ